MQIRIATKTAKNYIRCYNEYLYAIDILHIFAYRVYFTHLRAFKI